MPQYYLLTGMWMVSGGSIPGRGNCRSFIDEYDPIFIVTFCISAASGTLGRYYFEEV